MNSVRALIGVLAVMTMVVCHAHGQEQHSIAMQKVGEYGISGPYVSGNLSVFLVHGQDHLKGKTYLTLAEGMEQKKVIVHETGNVNELAVENVGDDDVYIQSGDIVKAASRTAPSARISFLSKNSGKVPIQRVLRRAWPLDRTRQRQRNGLFIQRQPRRRKELKLAARAEADQSKVWQQVAANQTKLSHSVAAPVAAPESPSSYQLHAGKRQGQKQFRSNDQRPLAPH